MFRIKGGYSSISRVYIATALILTISFINTTNMCMGNNLSGGNKEMSSSQRYITRRNRLTNISTAPSYIKFKLRDDETNQNTNILLENSELAEYLAGVRYDKSGRTSLPKNFNSFIENEYIPFLVENEGGIKELSISDFPRNLAAGVQFDEKSMKEFFSHFTYPGSLTLDKLSVDSEEELVNIYFDYDKNSGSGHLKKEYMREFNSNTAFISLLLDFNYDVGRMDIAPILYIRKIK